MQRSKNDQLDALVQREFAARMPFQGWARPSGNTLALWAIARRLQVLVAQRTAEKNRQHAARISQALPALLRREIARSLRSWKTRFCGCIEKRCAASPQRRDCGGITNCCAVFRVCEALALCSYWRNY